MGLPQDWMLSESGGHSMSVAEVYLQGGQTREERTVIGNKAGDLFLSVEGRFGDWWVSQ